MSSGPEPANPKYDVLFVTPVKGWSKRLDRKNVLEVFGKPMFVWSLEQIANSPHYRRSNSFVVTESPEVVSLLETWGYADLWHPMERKVDQTGITDLAMYLNWAVESGKGPPQVACIVYANCPARDPTTIDKCIALVHGGCNSVRTYNSKGIETGNVWAYKLDAEGPRAWYTYTGAVIDDALEIHTDADLEAVLETLRDRQLRQIEKEVVKVKPEAPGLSEEDRAILEQRL